MIRCRSRTNRIVRREPAQMSAATSLTELLHDLVTGLPRHDYRTLKSSLPANGIYFFFEKHELVTIGDRTIERIVRVGTHRAEGRLPARIRDHFFSNRRGSIFRRHLGGALLQKANSDDPRIAAWKTHKGVLIPEIEVLVSDALRDNFSYSCIRVDVASERLELERGLIALLARHPLRPPTDAWLGRHAVNRYIARSGLWNTQHVNADPLTPLQFNRLIELAGRPTS
jgi:hypothetical protein